jgi:hypothetical protein
MECRSVSTFKGLALTPDEKTYLRWLKFGALWECEVFASADLRLRNSLRLIGWHFSVAGMVLAQDVSLGPVLAGEWQRIGDNKIMKKLKNFIGRQISFCAAIMLAWACLATGTIGHAQTTAANLSPDLQEIVKFCQAHMTDDVILAYIKNSGKSYNVSADDMLYLNSQGVSQPVISALLQTKAAAPAPAAPAAPIATPLPAAPMVPPPGTMAPAPMPTPAPGLADYFNAEGGLNPALWTPQGNVLASLAAASGSQSIMPALVFGPAGMQMAGVNAPGQFTGVQSVGAYSAPFTLTARVTGLAEAAIPFEVYLVSPDLRQWLSVAGHLGGAGHREGDVRVVGGVPFFRGAVNVPLGGGPSPDHGVWVNFTGSAVPISTLGYKICEHAAAGVPYTIQMTVGPDGMASVAFLDAAGLTLGARNGMPVGPGPFYAVLAARNGPAFANWQSIELAPLAPPVAMVAPETPTIDYFQAQLTPYGHWIDVPEVGACWVPAEASLPGWRPYADAGHWEFTDAGWYWRSDYSWGEIAFHYGRWLNDARTGFVWAWMPQYDWAPSWVSWRYAEADGCMGWAPLPWDARFRAGVGIEWRGGIGVDLDFGLGFDAFVFVGRDHFWDHDYAHVFIGREDARRFWGHSEIHNGYRMDHGRFVAEGWGRDHVASFTHHEVAVHTAHEMRSAEEHHNLEVRHQQHPATAQRADERGKARTPASPTSAHPVAPTSAHPVAPTSAHPVAPTSAHPVAPTSAHPVAPTANKGVPPAKSKAGSSEKKPQDEKKSDNNK